MPLDICLKCEEDFKSEWIGNRLCPRCDLANRGYVGTEGFLYDSNFN